MNEKTRYYLLAISFFTPFLLNAGEQKASSMRIRVRTDIKADNVFFIKTENALPRLVIANHLMSHSATKVITPHSVMHNNAISSESNQISINSEKQTPNCEARKANSIEQKTKTFDTYVDRKIEFALAQVTDQKTLQIKTWQQLCQCIKLNRDNKRRYQCPFSTCTKTDSSRVDNIASCYLTHFDKIFFSCPDCTYICAKYSVLKTHYIYECKTTNLLEMSLGEKQISTKKNSFTHTNTIMIENSHGARSEELPPSSETYPNESPKPKSLSENSNKSKIVNGRG